MRMLRRLLQRLLVVAVGAVAIWLIVFVIFDFADRRLPWVMALAVTYGLAAYVVLPRAIRLGLRILQRGRVPSYTLTGDGLPGDPVNIALIGTKRQLCEAFAVMGWSEAAPLDVRSSVRMVRAFVLKEAYPNAPFSTLYLFGRGQDIGFQLPIDNNPRKRHHVRFWGRSATRAEQTIDTPDFWFGTDRPAPDEEALWVGAATKDIGFSLTRLSFQITHATDDDTNLERDFLVQELLRHDVIANIRSHRSGETIGKVNKYVTDGEIAVADLKV
ncbi:LssY C-terminal domain-containing protein [Pseudorhodoplanes sp.]|uniref:LssY C-terminal domain-containing protein n=1 Tax=Pseudorhodoplanes sp. TaxID=1934341 RepID=UPI00391935EB